MVLRTIAVILSIHLIASSIKNNNNFSRYYNGLISRLSFAALADTLMNAADSINFYNVTSNRLPQSVVLDMPTPGNQGFQYSCGAWAVIYAADYYMHTLTGVAYSDSDNLSPAFIYNQLSNGKCGITSLADNLKLLMVQGACTLKAMPYNNDDCSTQPNCMQKENAGIHKIKGWQKINTNDLIALKEALFHKKPVIFSIKVDEGFDRIAAPFIWKKRLGKTEQTHTMTISGYDNNRSAFLVMNSWGTAWGNKGFVWIDYDFLVKNALPNGYILL